MKTEDIKALSMALRDSNPSSVVYGLGHTPILEVRLPICSTAHYEPIKALIEQIFKVDFIDHKNFNIKFLNNHKDPATYPASDIASAIANQDKPRLLRYFLFKQFQITGIDIEIQTKNNVSFTSKVKRKKNEKS